MFFDVCDFSYIGYGVASLRGARNAIAVTITGSVLEVFFSSCGVYGTYRVDHRYVFIYLASRPLILILEIISLALSGFWVYMYYFCSFVCFNLCIA